MKLPPGVTVHIRALVFRGENGDEVPPELEAEVPEEVRLRCQPAAPRPQARAKEK